MGLTSHHFLHLLLEANLGPTHTQRERTQEAVIMGTTQESFYYSQYDERPINLLIFSRYQFLVSLFFSIIFVFNLMYFCSNLYYYLLYIFFVFSLVFFLQFLKTEAQDTYLRFFFFSIGSIYYYTFPLSSTLATSHKYFYVAFSVFIQFN